MTSKEFMNDTEMYQSFYLENVRLISRDYDMRFIHPSEIKCVDGLMNWEDKNPFLKDLEDDKLELGYDVLRRGTYFTFMIDEDYNVIEGRHRLWALQNIDVPIDKKFLCIISNDKRFDSPELLESAPKFDTPRFIYMQLARLYELKTVDEILNMKIEPLLDNPKIVKVYTDNRCLLLDYYVQYCIGMLRPMWLLEKNYDVKLKPSKIINDEDYFKRHLNEEDWNIYTGTTRERTLS